MNNWPNPEELRYWAQYVERKNPREPIEVFVRCLECVAVSPKGLSRTWRQVKGKWQTWERVKSNHLPKTEDEALRKLQELMLNPGFNKDEWQTCIDVIAECQRLIDLKQPRQIEGMENLDDRSILRKF